MKDKSREKFHFAVAIFQSSIQAQFYDYCIASASASSASPLLLHHQSTQLKGPLHSH